MKKAFIALLMGLSFTVNASLIGGFNGGSSFANFDILDFTPRNTIGINFYIDGEIEQRYRHVSFRLDVNTYNEIFNTDKELSNTLLPDRESKIIYSAKSENGKRTIKFETQFLDDDGMIAMKEETTVVMNNGKASINIKAYTRKVFFGIVGPLRKRSNETVTNLKIDASGVGLFGDNHGHPLGKVVTLEGLLNAASDTSTRALINACEVECLDKN